ncbi:MAG: SDR family NAD(P)-dependent oxidoreductase [Myxococcota bacterium]
MRKGIPNVRGRTAVITGGANGIGRALARGLLRRGAHLALVDLDEENLAALARQLQHDAPGRIISTHIVDVADRETMRALAQRVHDAHGGVDLLINNAGIGYEGAFQQTTLETWDHIIGVNLWGVIHGCHFFLPLLARAEQGHIVNLSSLFGYTGMAGQTAYCTTKYAIRGLSESLWEDLRDTSVGLTVVHPGSVATGIMKAAQGDDPELMATLADWYEKNAMSPDRAADRIIAAVERGAERLLISPEAVLVDVVKRLAPTFGNRAVCELILRVLGLSHMREQRRTQWAQTMLEGPLPWE